MERQTKWPGMLLLLGCLLSFMPAVAHDSNENDPLGSLNRKQRRHFESYAQINKATLEHQKTDANQNFERLFSPVRDWCTEMAPKFKYESMKAGDKAKATQNKRMHQEWIEKSALYWEIHESCLKLIKAVEAKLSPDILQEMTCIVANERKALSKRYPFPRRDWLTQSEANRLLFRLMAPQRARYQAKRKLEQQEKQKKIKGTAHNENHDDTDTEPRQGQVKRKQHDTRRREYGNGQTSGRGTRTQYNRRNLRQR